MKNLLLLSAFFICATIGYAQPACGDLTVTNLTPSTLDVVGQTGSSCPVIGNFFETVAMGDTEVITGTSGNSWMYLRIVGDGQYASPTGCSTFTCGTTGTSYTVTWVSCCEVKIEP